MVTICFDMHTSQQQSYILHLLCTVIHMPLVYSTPNNESNAVKDKGYLLCGTYSYIVN